MDAIALAVRVVLSAVLAAAAVAKFRDRGGSVTAMRDFGVPSALAPAAGLLLPAAEAVCCLALVLPPLARAGSVFAFLLFAAMTGAILRLLVLGQAPDCQCFGRLHSEPVGRRTLVRTAALAALAALVAARGPGSSLGGLGPLGVEALAPLLAAAAAGALARRGGAKRPRALFPDALSRGAPAPPFELPGALGGVGSLDSMLGDGRAVALVFVDSGCGPCRTLLGSLGQWRDGLADELTIAVISSGGREEGRVLGQDTGVEDILLDHDRKVSRAYGIPMTPCAVVVGAQGRVESAPVAGEPGIEALLRLALQRVREQPLTALARQR